MFWQVWFCGAFCEVVYTIYMARVELPQSSARVRRRKRRIWLVVAVLGLLLSVVALAVLLAHASFLRATAIETGDTGAVPSSSVEELVYSEIAGSYFFLFPKNNIFLYPKGALEELLRVRYPVIKDAQLRAKNFHTIEVALVLREPAALWCPESGPCRLMDEDGVVYADAPEFSAPLYVKYSGPISTSTDPALARRSPGEVGQFVTQEEFRSLFALVDALNKKVGSTSIEAVSIDEAGDVRARFQNNPDASVGVNFTLLFAQKDDGGDVFERFSLALESKLFKSRTLSDFEYLDLRFGEKLYYKLKTE